MGFVTFGELVAAPWFVLAGTSATRIRIKQVDVT